jgi:hypothetical protein
LALKIENYKKFKNLKNLKEKMRLPFQLHLQKVKFATQNGWG